MSTAEPEQIEVKSEKNQVGEGPVVSIIIPCWNEEAFIGPCLDSILATDYPQGLLEILIVDGMSEDRTRLVIESYQKKYPFIMILDNTRRFMPAAMNIGLARARGEIIMCMGAHASYAPDYVTKCVKYLQEYSADNVGGVMRTEPGNNTVIAQSIAFFMSQRFGSGVATFRRGTPSPRWVDTVFGGCYRRSVFERIGKYDESLIKGQDREFNQRLKASGGRILLVPEIHCTYYARGTLSAFLLQFYKAGFWPFYGGRVAHKRFLSLRNFIPAAFVGALAISLASSLFSRYGLAISAALLGPYLIVVLGSAIRLAIRKRDFRYLVAVPFVFGLGHTVYGFGSVYGLLKPMQTRPEAPFPAGAPR